MQLLKYDPTCSVASKRYCTNSTLCIGGVYWAQTFLTRSLLGLCIFQALPVYFGGNVRLDLFFWSYDIIGRDDINQGRQPNYISLLSGFVNMDDQHRNPNIRDHPVSSWATNFITISLSSSSASPLATSTRCSVTATVLPQIYVLFGAFLSHYHAPAKNIGWHIFCFIFVALFSHCHIPAIVFFAIIFL